MKTQPHLKLFKLALLVGLFLAVIRGCAKSETQRSISFDSLGIEIQGSIIIPGKPVAAVVFVHGSGVAERNIALARRFASEGIAAIVYDKRGTGRSGGLYEDNFASLSRSNLTLLAADASSAAGVFERFEETRDLPVGLVGISQAGWIIPLAASGNEHIRFMGIWSGPVCKVSEESLFSAYTSDQDFEAVPTFDEARNYPRAKPPEPRSIEDDSDSEASLQQLSIPGFWVFGANDGSIPVDLSVRNLKKLRIGGKRQYDYVVCSGVGHNNIEPTFRTMVDWIRSKALNPAKEVRPPEPWDKLIGLYRTKPPDPDLRILVKDGSLVVERKRAQFKLSHVEENRYSIFIEGDGYHFFQFNVAEGLLMIDEYDRYVLVTGE